MKTLMHNRHRQYLALITGIIFLTLSTEAPGDLIQDQDDSIVADGSATFDGFNLTLDTATGLEWPDPALAGGRSWNDVTSNFGPGGDYAGFRHATDAEVDQLVKNNGFPQGLGTTTSSPLGSFREFRSLILSVGGIFGPIFFTTGGINQVAGGQAFGPLISLSDTRSNTLINTFSLNGFFGLDDTAGVQGHWLCARANGTATRTD